MIVELFNTECVCVHDCACVHLHMLYIKYCYVCVHSKNCTILSPDILQNSSNELDIEEEASF